MWDWLMFLVRNGLYTEMSRNVDNVVIMKADVSEDKPATVPRIEQRRLHLHSLS